MLANFATVLTVCSQPLITKVAEGSSRVVRKVGCAVLFSDPKTFSTGGII
jgi:hypothetical protein